MTIQSADDLIVQSERERLGKSIPKISETKTENKAEPISTDAKPEEVQREILPPSDPKEVEKSEITKEPTKELEEDVEQKSKDTSEDNQTDDYGNKIPKGKTYTEEQVNAMIRDRLARERQARSNQQQQQVQEAAKNFEADPESSESWETQLEGFIEKTLNKLSTKNAQEEWKRKEENLQVEFETKFTQGMARYDDFQNVVANKPITDSMMMATRGMKDPAAFIYSACKNHAEEIARIAQLPDAVMQIAEIGKLEEKMKKPRIVTKAPAPSKKVSGDMTDDFPRLSIDQRIAEHAKSKIMQRGK